MQILKVNTRTVALVWIFSGFLSTPFTIHYFLLFSTCLYLYFRKLKHFYDTVSTFQSSPVYQLRHLVAPACVAMVTVTQMGATLMSYLDEDLSQGKNTDINTVHGNLLFVCSGIPVLKRFHCYFRSYIQIRLHVLTIIIQDVRFKKFCSL